MDDLGRIDRRRLLRQPDDANRPAGANHFQRLADRERAAGRLEYDVGRASATEVIAAHPKAVDHPFQRVAGARIEHAIGPALLRQHQAHWGHLDHHGCRTDAASSLQAGVPDHAATQNDHLVATLDARFGDGRQPHRHGFDGGGYGVRQVLGQAVDARPQGSVFDLHKFGEGAWASVAGRVLAPVGAEDRVAFVAGAASSADTGRETRHPIADRYPLHALADRGDQSHEFMPHDLAGLDIEPCLVAVYVRSADSADGDPDENVTRADSRGLDLLETDVPRRLIDRSAHARRNTVGQVFPHLLNVNVLQQCLTIYLHQPSSRKIVLHDYHNKNTYKASVAGYS